MIGNSPDYPLYSISEIYKRTKQLAFVAIAIGFLVFIIYWIAGLYNNAIMSLVFCCVISLILYLKHKEIINNTKLPVITFVSLSLIIFTLKEGLGTGLYLYYFPLMVAIPVIVDNHKTYIKKIVLYFTISAVCFVICIVVGKFHQPWEPLSVFNKQIIFCINSFFAVVTTIGFAFVNIFFERKYLKELLEQKNRTINTRTQFLSTMGHELRTPLNGIIGAINILKNEPGLVGQQEYFEILKYCSDHMLNQVNDILDFNKIEAGKLEIHPVEVNLKRLLVNSTIPFQNQFEEKNLELKVIIDPELDTIVLADDVRLIQVLNNLFSNAGKFTKKGYVKLEVKLISKDKDWLQVKFSVTDTGSGIAEKNLKYIFDNFGQVYDKSTRKNTGSGLGLNICLRILKLMDSKLEVKSAVGVGSTFSFDIKFKKIDQQKIVEQSLTRENTNLAGVKILLVEDNKINMIVAVKTLMDLKAVCTKAFNGQEALALLEENADYQIVLMDLEMPVMDGYATVNVVKKNWPNIPVLAFTATMMDLEMLDNLKAIGFADYISKPFQPSHLMAQIKKYTEIPSL